MDLQKQFKDMDFHEDESDKIIKELEERLSLVKKEEVSVEETDRAIPALDENIPEEYFSEIEEKEYIEPTFLEKIQPFIVPICLTLFAIFFAALFLYFFSKSRIQNAPVSITNNGGAEEVVIKYEKPKQEVVVVPEKLTCVEPQILNEKEDKCIDPVPEPVVQEKITFENGTTTELNVRFSFDKFNYDNYPAGIYLNEGQIFDGDFEGYKLLPTNRAFANDMFFGIDRYMVSLIGACKFQVDDVQILVSNMRDSEGDQVYSMIKDKYFRGKVVKILDSSKPHVVCGK